MNKERLEMLAAHLEKLPNDEFNMEVWCGGPCCIAGHAAIMAGVHTEIEANLVRQTAREWLGLEHREASRLFMPALDRAMMAKPPQAASVVRHLKDTGVVAWEKFL